MENIQVALRIRPLNEKEALFKEKNYWQISDKSTNISLLPQKIPEFSQKKHFSAKTCYSFTYDQCFSEDSTNEEIYEKNVKKIVLSSLLGINGTIFMYGQTGAGKTFTMLGKKGEIPDEISISSEKDEKNIENKGVLLIALRDFFEAMKQDPLKSYIIHCTYIEIYNENTYDLLSTSHTSILNIVEDVTRKEFFVKGVNEMLVSSLPEITKIIRKAEINRHYAFTSLNRSSSRSHTIFTIKVKSIANNACSLTESMLNFVDLAGSEKLSNYQEEDCDREYLSDCTISETGVSSNFARRLKEGQFINKSLFFLTHVISLRSEGKT